MQKYTRRGSAQYKNEEMLNDSAAGIEDQTPVLIKPKRAVKQQSMSQSRVEKSTRNSQSQQKKAGYRKKK